MAISGNINDDGSFYNIAKQDLNMDVDSFKKRVGNVQGKKFSSTEYVNMLQSKNPGQNNFNMADVKSDTDTVMNKYGLKGKAGITANFYNAFSAAFDSYMNTIKNDLNNLETNVKVKQAFSGTELEKSIENLIAAVKEETMDYLFKLERTEKSVIDSVQKAFQKQQSNMSTSMGRDTRTLRSGNDSQTTMDNFHNGDYEKRGLSNS